MILALQGFLSKAQLLEENPDVSSADQLKIVDAVVCRRARLLSRDTSTK